MPKGYRKIKYFTEQEAEDFAQLKNDENKRVAMAGSYYEAEKEDEGRWIVNHYVLRQLVASHVKNGMLPYDYEEGYLEGYIRNY